MSYLINIFTIFVSVLIGLIIFLLFDFSYNYWASSRVKSCAEAKKNGFYELKPNCKGMDRFYTNYFPVYTDSYGFRVAKPEIEGNQKKKIIFLGDSFTYGVNGVWEETFVGMFQDQIQFKVVNAGLGSYSPTVYLYQYKKALNSGVLTKKHDVIIALDISDVQDQAGYWERGSIHPRKMAYSINLKSKESQGLWSVKVALARSLPFTRALHQLLRKYLPGYEGTNVADIARSAFTHIEWESLNKEYAAPDRLGYLPLGVEGGLNSVRKEIIEIKKLADLNNSRLFLLTYPWPAQIKYDQKVFSWNKYVSDMCSEIGCHGFINTFTAFENSLENGFKLNDIYQLGDVHFTVLGNKVLADELALQYKNF